MYKLEIEFDSSVFNADVTESDRNTCKRFILEESKAEFFRYFCGSCNFKATTQGSLKTHKEFIPNVFKYSCDTTDSSEDT